MYHVIQFISNFHGGHFVLVDQNLLFSFNIFPAFCYPFYTATAIGNYMYVIHNMKNEGGTLWMYIARVWSTLTPPFAIFRFLLSLLIFSTYLTWFTSSKGFLPYHPSFYLYHVWSIRCNIAISHDTAAIRKVVMKKLIKSINRWAIGKKLDTSLMGFWGNFEWSKNN